MSKRFLMNILSDSILVYPLIFAGLILNLKPLGLDLAVAAQFLFWFMIVLYVFGCTANEKAMKDYSDGIKNKRSQAHKSYQFISLLVEVCLMVSAGFYVLGGFWLIGSLCSMSINNEIESKYMNN